MSGITPPNGSPGWSPLTPGSVLKDRYVVDSLLGRGGFGATYCALDKGRFEAPCAVKEFVPLDESVEPFERALARFEREAYALLELNHPGVPKLHEFFQHDGRFFLVQDFVNGENLAEWVHREGPRSTEEVAHLLDQLFGILEYLHGRQPPVVHRDVKPDNIIRSDDGQIHLVDFGAVREAITRHGAEPLSAIYTPGYAPVSQLMGTVTPQCDLFAAGATAAFLLTGTHPQQLYDPQSGAFTLPAESNVPRQYRRLISELTGGNSPLSRSASQAKDEVRALRSGATTLPESGPPEPRRTQPMHPGDGDGLRGLRPGAPATGGDQPPAAPGSAGVGQPTTAGPSGGLAQSATAASGVAHIAPTTVVPREVGLTHSETSRHDVRKRKRATAWIAGAVVIGAAAVMATLRSEPTTDTVPSGAATTRPSQGASPPLQGTSAAATGAEVPAAETPAPAGPPELDAIGRSSTQSGLEIEVLYPTAWRVVSTVTDEHLALRDPETGALFLAGVNATSATDVPPRGFVDQWSDATARRYATLTRIIDQAPQGDAFPFALELVRVEGGQEQGTMLVTPFAQPDGSGTLFRWWATFGNADALIPTFQAMATSLEVTGPR